MRVVLAVLLLVGLVHARPQLLKPLSDAAKALITKFDSTSNELGEYTYSFESDDGQIRYETREVQNAGTDQETAKVKGFYSYIDPEGKRKTVGYEADGEKGYYAEGEHLPDSASARRKPPEVGIPPNAVSSLAGGGLGR